MTLLSDILGNLGSIEELLSTAEKLAEAKSDSEAKEKVKKMREGLGKAKGKAADFETAKSQGLGGLFSQILNFVEKASSQEETKEFEIDGKKGIISQGFRIGGLGGPGRQSSEKFTVKRQEPRARRPEKKPVVKEDEMWKIDMDPIEEDRSSFKIVGYMPGVDKKDILCEVRENGTILRISGEGRKKYEQEIELPSAVTKEVNWTYNNGILEITLTKREQTQKS